MAPSLTSETPADTLAPEVKKLDLSNPKEQTATPQDDAVKPATTEEPTAPQDGAVTPPAEEESHERRTDHREPLKLSGALKDFKHFEVTPVLGREYEDIDLAALLQAPNSDDLIRDLAITISQRGVVFFRKQETLTDALQKELGQRLGQLTGKPAESGLHIHPVLNAGRGEAADDELSVISSRQRKKLYQNGNYFRGGADKKQTQRREWHSDITFEPVPSDYTILKMTELPSTGGDTLWASGYEVYDRISPALRSFLDTLSATYAQPGFNAVASGNSFPLYTNPRGHPLNVGEVLRAIHPVIRTNPVTGWKSVFAVGTHVQSINGLTEEESQHFLNWFTQLVVENHDLQVRHKWKNVGDVAIWDNRSVYHAATPDYDGGKGHEPAGERSGTRVVGLGERPYFDESSLSRREALEKAAGSA